MNQFHRLSEVHIELKLDYTHFESIFLSNIFIVLKLIEFL